jgi:AraC-like DNA-binding protein
MSERTLSRKLTEECTTYDEIVDQLRRSLALQYIKDRGILLSETAWLLGYEGSTSFNHAFVRWTGRSPSMSRGEKHFPPLTLMRARDAWPPKKSNLTAEDTPRDAVLIFHSEGTLPKRRAAKSTNGVRDGSVWARTFD